MNDRNHCYVKLVLFTGILALSFAIPGRSVPAARQTPPERKNVKLQLAYANAQDVAHTLRTDKAAFVPKGIVFSPDHDNTLLVTYTDENDMRSFKEIIRLMDVARDEVEIVAEALVDLGPSATDGRYLMVRSSTTTQLDH